MFPMLMLQLVLQTALLMLVMLQLVLQTAPPLQERQRALLPMPCKRAVSPLRVQHRKWDCPVHHSVTVIYCI